MNPLVLYFASGESFYSGAGLLFLTAAFSPLLRRRWGLLRNTLAWVALAMIVMACPPLPLAIDSIFLASFLLWIMVVGHAVAGPALGGLREAATGLLLVLLLVVFALEFPHRKVPSIAGAPSGHLVVIGDSLSSGIAAGGPAWPSVFEHMTGFPVKSLSQPGAGVTDGLALAERIEPGDKLVLIELGGNDLLGDMPSGVFARKLDAIAAKLFTPGRTLVMFELPLMPNKIGYGKVQRQVAAKYAIWLIPKRCLTSVLAGVNATSDGLHLSSAGADRMAKLVERVLSPVMRSHPLTSFKTGSRAEFWPFPLWYSFKRA